MTIQAAPAIQLQNLTKTYRLFDSHFDRLKETFLPGKKRYHREHHALQDVNLEVQHGEFYGIIGRNGSGKSTLLQIVAGILQPNQGEVRVNGRVAALLELGAGFNPEFTGRQNVFLNASILGMSQEETEARFEEIEEFAEIGSFIDQPVKTYSSGMYVRLAFAVAINVQPEILIVDEALAVGDMFFQQKCIQHMEEKMQGCTKLLVTHDMHAVVNMCERVAVLDKGKLAFEGKPIESAEYYTRTLHNELFGGNENDNNVSATLPEGKLTQASESSMWLAVSSEERAGAGDVVITHVRITGAEDKPVATAQPGDELHIQMQLSVSNTIDEPIFGYLVRDRVGNAICGDNTISLEVPPQPLQPGKHHVSLHIRWPDICPADYLITLGVGQGNHPLYHVIQCWAHNKILVKGINPGKEVHGIFTNNITKCEVDCAAS